MIYNAFVVESCCLRVNMISKLEQESWMKFFFSFTCKSNVVLLLYVVLLVLVHMRSIETHTWPAPGRGLISFCTALYYTDYVHNGQSDPWHSPRRSRSWWPGKCSQRSPRKHHTGSIGRGHSKEVHRSLRRRKSQCTRLG